jgi:hypothetical protein
MRRWHHACSKALGASHTYNPHALRREDSVETLDCKVWGVPAVPALPISPGEETPVEKLPLGAAETSRGGGDDDDDGDDPLQLPLSGLLPRCRRPPPTPPRPPADAAASDPARSSRVSRRERKHIVEIVHLSV